MRLQPAWTLGFCLGFCLALSGVARGQTPDTKQLTIDLPVGTLKQALDRLTAQTGLQILYDPELVQGRFANQVQGTMTAGQALQRLLQPTDVTYQFTRSDAVALLAVPAAPVPEVRVTAPEPRFVSPTNRDHIGRIWAPVKINGKGPFRLVVDTGASQSAIIARTARALGIPPEARPTRLYGVTGTAVVPSVHVDALELGDLLIETRSLPIVGDVFGGAEGILGRDGLQDKRIMADFRHDQLVIGASHQQAAPQGYKLVRLNLTNMGLLAADSRVGNIRAIAIIDTGAQCTIGNLALRDALMRRRPEDAQTTDVMGVTLDIEQGDNMHAPPIVLGEVRVSGTHITFGDMSLFEHWHLTNEPTVLIGMDVLGLLDVVIIDYKMHEMQVRLHDPDERRGLDPRGL
jgi:predicted aspartyl protease